MTRDDSRNCVIWMLVQLFWLKCNDARPTLQPPMEIVVPFVAKTVFPLVENDTATERKRLNRTEWGKQLLVKFLHPSIAPRWLCEMNANAHVSHSIKQLPKQSEPRKLQNKRPRRWWSTIEKEIWHKLEENCSESKGWSRKGMQWWQRTNANRCN
jgi:hypothetical protein